VGAVDQRVHSPLGQPPDQFFDRKHDCRGAGHVIDQRQPGALGDAAEHGLDDLSGRRDGDRHLDDHEPGAALLGHVAGHVVAGVVAVVGSQQLVAWLEAERSEHRVDPGRGVGHEHQVLRLGADQRGQRLPRAIEQARQLADQEPDRLGLHLPPQLGLPLEDRPGTGPEGTVVELHDGRVQGPSILAERGRQIDRIGVVHGGAWCIALRDTVS